MTSVREEDYRYGFLRTCIDQRFVASTREAFEKASGLRPADYWHEAHAGGVAVPLAWQPKPNKKRAFMPMTFLAVFLRNNRDPYCDGKTAFTPMGIQKYSIGKLLLTAIIPSYLLLPVEAYKPNNYSNSAPFD